jgi:hypothetical protein
MLMFVVMPKSLAPNVLSPFVLRVIVCGRLVNREGSNTIVSTPWSPEAAWMAPSRVVSW